MAAGRIVDRDGQEPHGRTALVGTKVDRRNVVARSNDHYGIPERRFVSRIQKAQQVDHVALERYAIHTCG